MELQQVYAFKLFFNEVAFPPVTASQLAAVGIDRSDLYWSGTLSCWRFCGETARNTPCATTGQILDQLGLTPDSRA